MNSNIKISIIVPAYNVASWLPKCLDSILAQTYSNIEVIVIDDGSKDETSKIVDVYAKKDKRIIGIHQENAGLIAVREKGIALATGEYVGFVDGDDTITADMYQRLLANALKYDADISQCGMCFCYPDGVQELHYGTGKMHIFDNLQGTIELLKGERIEPSLCNKLYKRHLLVDSCLDHSIVNNEDLLRNFVLFQRATKSVFEDFCGYQYWKRDNSMSNNLQKIRIARHVLKARSVIVENSTDSIYPYAMRTWLSALINSVNGMVFSDNEDERNFCKECRMTLIKEKKNLHYLIKRQQIAAWLIIGFPPLHKLVYKLYKM